MLSRIVKTTLIATSLSPILLSMAYTFYDKKAFWPTGALCFFSAIFLGAMSLKIINLSKRKLETLQVTIKKVKSADKEVIGFFLAYVLPVIFSKTIKVDTGSLIIFAALFAFVVWGTHAFHTNPVLGVFGYHFYEIETEDGVMFVLITKEKVVNVKNIQSVVQLTEYMVLER